MPTNTENPVVAPFGKKVAIIGGGPSGAITLDCLVQENHFEEIVLFERRDILGGIWVLDDPPNAKNDLLAPGGFSRDIDPPLDSPFDTGSKNPPKIIDVPPSTQERFIHTPSYSGMLTNIIERIMTFSDEQYWRNGTINKYADREDVRAYVDRYINRHKSTKGVRIETGVTVEHVTKTDAENGVVLTLRKSFPDHDSWIQEQFDHVVVATGHYHVPNIPSVPGLEQLQQEFPGVVEHSKWFRGGAKYKGKTVVVVGARTSGADVARAAADFATVVYQLIRGPEDATRMSKKGNVFAKPVVERIVFDRNKFLVVFADGSTVQPDHIVYATGYQFLYPFLQKQYGDITSNGALVPKAYLHTFLIDEPRIAIVGIPTDAISFRIFEYQAVLVARFLSNRIGLPPKSEQLQWANNRFQQRGQTRKYHLIGAADALQFMKTLEALGDGGISEYGRSFPKMTELDVKEYVENLTELRNTWAREEKSGKEKERERI